MGTPNETQLKKSKKTLYQETLHLPQTGFPMRGALPKKEPLQVEAWKKGAIFKKLLKDRKERKLSSFVLHDGPPYANGRIHLGQALNKTLKDICVKYHALNGAYTPYIPGWDCHGLPIERAVEKKSKRVSQTPLEIRKACRAFAKKMVDIQRDDFQRLGVFGLWDQPYLTMDFLYESDIVRSFGILVEQGLIYRGFKPVPWCSHCQTALADAEIEYHEKTSPSIYVAFDWKKESQQQFEKIHGLFSKPLSFVIWTTTPWTLPGNVAVALSWKASYVVLESPQKDRYWIIAEALKESFEKTLDLKIPLQEKARFLGKEFEHILLNHPFLNQTSQVILGDHVTLETGTGAVHTAPGHGEEDYVVGQQYALPIRCPVDEKGRFTEAFSQMKGLFVFKANQNIIELLKEKHALLKVEDIQHSYPHCWRCHKPLIFRATAQWFLKVDHPEQSLRKQALEAIEKVKWLPSWSKNRMRGMLETRPDWCLSRQRVWGVPIPALKCQKCQEVFTTPGFCQKVADCFQEGGSDLWFEKEVSFFLPDTFLSCPSCGAKEFEKTQEILDVWFDSGISHEAVCKRREEIQSDIDLYLEGSDQHRGWFQVSLLTSLAFSKKAPYHSILSHGFVVDKDGYKMSKSKGNVVSPMKIIEQYGADLLRLWVASEDYRKDISFSYETMRGLTDSYRKIRNTIRFLLGNLFDFDPRKDAVALSERTFLDQWALAEVGTQFLKILSAYENFEFYRTYQQMVHLSTVTLSSLYFDFLKDRLYTEEKKGLLRRSAQTTLWDIGNVFLKILAPILSFTSEEAWGYFSQSLKKQDYKKESIFLGQFPKKESIQAWIQPSILSQMEKVFSVREEVLKSLEVARKEKIIGHGREAQVCLTIPEKEYMFFKNFPSPLSKIFLVSQVEIQNGTPFSINVQKAKGSKCVRCWVYDTSVGSTKEHPLLCDRCVKVVQAR